MGFGRLHNIYNIYACIHVIIYKHFFECTITKALESEGI